MKNKKKVRKKTTKQAMTKLDYKIISSGSKGNCVIIEDMMFDCGVPYKWVKEDLYKISYLLLTHRHTDHINKMTINKIIQKYPRIKIIENYDLGDIFKSQYLVGDETEIKLKDRTIQAFKCVHDVPCSGYVVRMKAIDFIYATDTASLDYAPKIKYDYMFIESNHDEKKIEQIRNRSDVYGYDAWAGAMRHLSTQKSQLFYFLNRKSKKSERIELHKSERFY